MENLKPILAQHPFFKDLAEEHLLLITGCASNVRFEAGQYIFREGEEAHQFYLVRQGKVGIEIVAPDRGPITIQTLSDGDILGWSWLNSSVRMAFRRPGNGIDKGTCPRCEVSANEV